MNIYVKLGLILAIVLSVMGAVYWVAEEIDEGKKQAYKFGHDQALLDVAQRDNAELVVAQVEIDRLRKLAAAQEAEHQMRLEEMDQDATRRLADVEARKEKFVGDVVAGRIRLRDPGRKPDAACPGGTPGGASTALTAGGVGDAAGAGELSAALAGFLGSEAARADKVVVKVTYLQGLVREYLATCNAGLAAAGVSSH